MSTSISRSRWAAFGAAVAISLGAGGVGLTHATTSSGAKPVFVPLEQPCRLASTRPAPDTVGPRTTGIGPEETYVLDGWGTEGSCDLPTGSAGLALNVTAVDATQQTNLRFFAEGTTVPDTANLNPTPGAPPTPNAVNVTLNDANGKFSVFNKFGRVAVVIDVMGYYDDHNHDDIYYTKTEIDETYYTKTEIDEMPIADLSFDGHLLTPRIASENLVDVGGGTCVGYSELNTSIFGSLTVPVGATLTGFTATWYDEAVADVQVGIWKRLPGGSTLQGVATVTSTGDGGFGTTTSDPLTEVIDPGEQFLVSFIFPTVTEDADLGGLCGIELALQ
jgi:hypothetical protein